MGTEHELGRAREYVLSGNYGLAVELLSDCEDWPVPLNEPALILRAEVALRRDPVSALELLARVNDLFVTHEGRFGYYLTSGKAYAHGRNLDAAADMFASAAAVVADGFPAGAAELAYQSARLEWLRHDYDPDSDDLAKAVASGDAGLRFEALAVRAWMHAGLGNYRAQLADLVAAIAVADQNLERCDLRAVTRVLHTLLRVALELGDTEAAAIGERLFERVVWTDDLCEEHFLVLRALGWDAFLRGQSARAQWLFRDSKEVAPSDAWKVMAHVDRAAVARLNRNDVWAIDEVFEAHALARTVVWSDTHGEERQSLAMLAVLFAPLDMSQAQHYVSTSIRIGMDNVDASLAITQDRRADAFALYASGRVQQVLGNASGAKKALEESYRIFVDSEYHFRAALVAEALAELTQDKQWTARALDHAGHFPQSALYTYLASPAKPESAATSSLNPFRKQLAAALCEGLDPSRLSRRFSRSEFTIRREIKAVFDTFGVRSLSGLRECFEERGGS